MARTSGRYLPILRRARPLTTIDRQPVKPSGNSFGPVWTFFDSGTGTITLSGFGIDSYGKVDAGAGTVSLSGTTVFSSAPVLTNFTGTDENPLSEGGTWAGPVDSTDAQMRRVSNAAKGAASNAQSYRTDISTADVDASFVVTTIPPSGKGAIVLVRVQNPGNASTAAAYLWTYIVGTGFQWYSLTAGHTYTPLGTALAPHVLANGESLGARAVGTLLTGYYKTGATWVPVASIVDSTITGAGSAGIGVDESVTTVLDTFAAGAPVSPETFGKVFSDSGTGSLTLSGTVAARSQSNADSRTGTITFNRGTVSEFNSNTGFSDNPLPSIEFTLSGTKTEAASWADHTTGTVTLSGTGVESAGKSDAGSGTLTLSGSGVQTPSYADSRTGTISLSTIPVSTIAAYPGNFYPGQVYPGQTVVSLAESLTYTDSRTITFTLTGSGVESYSSGGTLHNDSGTGTLTLGGTGDENFGALEASEGTIRLSGHGSETHSGSRGTLTLVPDTEDTLTLVPA